MTIVTKISQLNCNDHITYKCADGELAATVSHVRIGRNGNNKMVPFLNLRVDAHGNKLAHDIELLSGIEMYRIKKVL